ncbi:hypothetical protein BT96DRAFT_937743 [Gymnopus androsaceus JB14]|uniref:Uncharacterized protein n=1 Tax=Gymnopus androsaceus JB14 TaxID=1447944 RepID=A0A6A4HVF4_9AGAR|nr:hypothetical protein BT96DRAFT_937743 [Gymnopus androsaceus JB14]
MSNVQPLPARNEQKAPKWDSQYEEQLPTFFEEFETIAKEAAIDSDDLKMKKEALRYVDTKTMRFWRSLDTVEDDQKTWDKFKKEVLSNYPRAEQVPETTTDTLKKVVTKFAKSGVLNSQELAEYHQEFATVSKLLTKHGILSGVQVAGYYVQVFPDLVHVQLNMRLQVQHTAKKKGEAYSLAELKGAVDFLLSDANTSMIVGNFNIGDQSVAPISSITAMVVPKVEPTESKLDQLTQTVSLLAQLMAQMALKGDRNSNRSRNDHSPKLSCSNKCFWDNCDSPKFDDCMDLREWVSQGRIERDANGSVQLRGGQRLPQNQRYTEGTLKQRFECYFEDHPSKKTWMWESPMVESNPFRGVDVGVHSRYTVHGYQGPAMMEKASTYMATSLEHGSFEGEPEEEAICQLLFKIETCRAAKEKAVKDVPEHYSKPKLPVPQPPVPPPPSESSSPVPIPGPARVPKPVIGKLLPNYVPPQERTVGVPPKDDRNFQYRAPIETEAAVERVVQAGFSSLVSIQQEDLLAIAPEY